MNYILLSSDKNIFLFTRERIEIDKKKLLDELTGLYFYYRKIIIFNILLPLRKKKFYKHILLLIDFCKSLSKSEALGELSNLSSEEDGSESDKGFHHPFLLKERPSPIVMNIRVCLFCNILQKKFSINGID